MKLAEKSENFSMEWGLLTLKRKHQEYWRQEYRVKTFYKDYFEP